MNLKLENRFGEEYRETFEMKMMGLSENNIPGNDEWFCVLEIENFNIERL